MQKAENICQQPRIIWRILAHSRDLSQQRRAVTLDERVNNLIDFELVNRTQHGFNRFIGNLVLAE